MSIVTRKSEVKEYLSTVLTAYRSGSLEACVEACEVELLRKKVKFPLLEYCAHELYSELASDDHILFCDKIEALKYEGGNVILGIMLQNRLSDNFEESLLKTTEYVSKADIWYVCDIIGERVFGYALRTEPQKAISTIKLLFDHENIWVIRSLGAGIHNAVRKELNEEYVRQLFPLLLSKAAHKNKEVRQGVGWAAKTTARFHPSIIKEFEHKIDDSTLVANWFRAKIKIGLNRHAYATRN